MYQIRQPVICPEDKLESIQGLIQTFLEPSGEAFVEELVFRFLLTRGDTLGGSMRNVGGALAQRKVTRAIISMLTLANIPYHWMHKASNTWFSMTEDDADIEVHLRGISWRSEGRNRTILYNITVPLVGNNVDVCLFDCVSDELSERISISSVVNTPAQYIALGELKGGIDPAGADEHWKTAGTALLRIRRAFQEEGQSPYLFFVGAAIEKRMADEMWKQLEHGLLHNAANLTDADQVASFVAWLCAL